MVFRLGKGIQEWSGYSLTALLVLGHYGLGQTLLAKVPIDNIGIASYKDYRPLEKLGLERFYRSDPEK